MSVPSSNVTTTCDRPNFEIERTSSRPGRPLIACSTGKVICRSISSGESDGATVLICTWTGVVSGKASMSKWPSENAPRPANTSATATTSTRCRSEKSMIQLSMGSSQNATGGRCHGVAVTSRLCARSRISGPLFAAQQPSPRLFFSNSARSTSLPLVATTSPGKTPAMISVDCSFLAPSRTVRMWNTLGLSWLVEVPLSRTNTTWQQPSQWTASLGTTMASCSSRRTIRPAPNVSLRSCPFGLGNSARTVTIRVCWSAVVLIQTSVPLTSSRLPSGRKRTGCPKASLPASSTETLSCQPHAAGVGHLEQDLRRVHDFPRHDLPSYDDAVHRGLHGKEIGCGLIRAEMLGRRHSGRPSQSKMFCHFLFGQRPQLLDVDRKAEIP